MGSRSRCSGAAPSIIRVEAYRSRREKAFGGRFAVASGSHSASRVPCSRSAISGIRQPIEIVSEAEQPRLRDPRDGRLRRRASHPLFERQFAIDESRSMC